GSWNIILLFAAMVLTPSGSSIFLGSVTCGGTLRAMCVSEERWSERRTQRAAELPLPPLDARRFRFVQILAQQERHGGQIELYDDLQEDCKVVGKRLLRSWTLDSSEEFSEANPELLESPWKEMELSVKVASVKGVCKCLGAFEDAGQ
ncbi:unnamed protein product, partial [Durusdinium trenchii]